MPLRCRPLASSQRSRLISWNCSAPFCLPAIDQVSLQWTRLCLCLWSTCSRCCITWVTAWIPWPKVTALGDKHSGRPGVAAARCRWTRDTLSQLRQLPVYSDSDSHLGDQRTHNMGHLTFISVTNVSQANRKMVAICLKLIQHLRSYLWLTISYKYFKKQIGENAAACSALSCSCSDAAIAGRASLSLYSGLNGTSVGPGGDDFNSLGNTQSNSYKCSIFERSFFWNSLEPWCKKSEQVITQLQQQCCIHSLSAWITSQDGSYKRRTEAVAQWKMRQYFYYLQQLNYHRGEVCSQLKESTNWQYNGDSIASSFTCSSQQGDKLSPPHLSLLILELKWCQSPPVRERHIHFPF